MKPRHIIPLKHLPRGIAEALERPPTHPVTPVPAATVVLLRGSERGLEVLLLKRARRSGFVPGAYVFPGGRVDPQDSHRELLSRLEGLDQETAAVRLDLRSAEPPAIAYYLAAVREAFEETGVLIGRPRAGGAPAPRASDRQAGEQRTLLMDDRRSFQEVLAALDCVVDGGALEYIAHWITPEVEPRRYDTRFFAAVAPQGAEVVLDEREMVEARWLRPREALSRNQEGGLPMVFPTIQTLRQLAEFENPGQVLAAFRERDIPTILPRMVRVPEGLGLELP